MPGANSKTRNEEEAVDDAIEEDVFSNAESNATSDSEGVVVSSGGARALSANSVSTTSINEIPLYLPLLRFTPKQLYGIYYLYSALVPLFFRLISSCLVFSSQQLASANDRYI